MTIILYASRGVWEHVLLPPPKRFSCPETAYQGVARVYFFTEALAKFQHVNCMNLEVKRVDCYAGAENFTEAVASMVASYPLAYGGI